MVIVAAFAMLSFLFLLDLNELRKNTIEETSISDFFDHNNMVIDRVDTTVRPYIKQFLKVMHYHSNVPYSFSREEFYNKTSFQAISDFAKTANISNTSDFFGFLKRCVIEETVEDPESSSVPENDYYKIGTKVYKIISDLFKDKHTMEINTTKIYETF